MKDYYTAMEAAQRLGINRKTLQEWKTKGIFPNGIWYKFGPKQLRFDKEKLENWIEEQKK